VNGDDDVHTETLIPETKLSV